MLILPNDPLPLGTEDPAADVTLVASDTNVASDTSVTSDTSDIFLATPFNI